MVRFYIRVSGYVQGVGFRWFVQQTAGLFSLTGWVQNLSNGDVDMEVQGCDADVAAFIDRIKEGNRYADVRDMDLRQLEPIQESSFRIADWF